VVLLGILTPLNHPDDTLSGDRWKGSYTTDPGYMGWYARIIRYPRFLCIITGEVAATVAIIPVVITIVGIIVAIITITTIIGRDVCYIVAKRPHL